MTVILSGFADEISPDPGEQLAVLAAEDIRHLELRSAWSTNVADLGDAELARFAVALGNAGVHVSAIGSPIGKIPVGAPLEPELDRMRRIADVAGGLGATIVRSSRSSSLRENRRSATGSRSSTACAPSRRSPRRTA